MDIIFEIRVSKYDLIIRQEKEALLVIDIKTTRQRKYRGLKEFYREVNSIKVNQIDNMLEMFSRGDKSLEERFMEQEKMLNDLDIDKQEIIEAYRREVIKYIENYEYK